MNHPSDPLPLLPAELLRRYSCAEPTDTRFRAIARLRQSLWREQHGYACGRYVDANGRTRRLGPRQPPRRPDRRQPGRPHPDPPRPARDRVSRGRRCHPRRASLDQPVGQPGPDLQSLRPVQATARAGHGRDAPAGPRSGRRGDRGAVRALAGTRPPRLHRRPHRLRRADPLHDTARAARLCRDRDEILGGTRRHRLTGAATLRHTVAVGRRLPRCGRTGPAPRADRAVLARAVACHRDARAGPLSRRHLPKLRVPL